MIAMVMKRIEAFIASEKTPYVLSALDGLGLQATFFDSKGMGKGEKYTVSYGKGSGTQKMAYSTRSIVVSIVEENKVKEAVSIIKDAATTGSASGGIVVISSVDDIVVI
jgi:nitrogen regulatory protein PII